VEPGITSISINIDAVGCKKRSRNLFILRISTIHWSIYLCRGFMEKNDHEHMQFEKCNFCSGEKCTASDLESCDFKGDDFQKCLRYKLHFLRPQLMQLR